MDKKKTAMKRVNVILETDLYDKARIIGFIRKKSLSEIVRDAPRLAQDEHRPEGQLVLSEKDDASS
jgi:hypothetical protein